MISKTIQPKLAYHTLFKKVKITKQKLRLQNLVGVFVKNNIQLLSSDICILDSANKKQ